MKKHRLYIKLLQILEWNAATESAHTEAEDKAFEAGTVLMRIEYLCALTIDDVSCSDNFNEIVLEITRCQTELVF